MPIAQRLPKLADMSRKSLLFYAALALAAAAALAVLTSLLTARLAAPCFAPRGFDLLAVAMSYDPPEYVRNYTQQHRLPFRGVLDTRGDIARAFDNVNLTPTAVIIDKQGRVLRRIVGEPDFAALHALIDKELAA